MPRVLKAISILLPLLLITAGAVWYQSPVHVEELDAMVYCACGMTPVKFSDGRIIMVSYHHDNPKPGDLIGVYKTDGRDIEMQIYFNGTTNTERLTMDHIGVLAPKGMLFFDHVAVDASKARIRRLLHRN